MAHFIAWFLVTENMMQSDCPFHREGKWSFIAGMWLSANNIFHFDGLLLFWDIVCTYIKNE